jgi:hypothetical protein
MRKAPEASLAALHVGAVYRIVGSFHVAWAGVWAGTAAVVGAVYAGTCGGPHRHLFRDSTRSYLVTAPELTAGVHAARVFLLRKRAHT